jgi:2'-hydroxyisoflavone reductase
MHLLIPGGTTFLGRHIVEAARSRGHEVTLFNRGRHAPELFPDVEKIRGDRDADLSALNGRRFDAVMDTSGYRPAQMLAMVEALRDSIEHYTFISSISVYRRFSPGRRFDENAKVADGAEGYGPLKARSEEAITSALPGRVACVRPGLIVGQHDPTDRFTYWPRRVAQGGRVLAPGRPERPVQFIDVRDLAEWCVRLAEKAVTGVFNATGPDPVTMSGLLESCRAVARTDATFEWIGDADLLAAHVQPWSELPLWIPESDPDFGGMLLADNHRAVAAGLTFRPVAETIAATLEWDREAGSPTGPSAIRVTPMTRERETELLTRRSVQ